MAHSQSNQRLLDKSFLDNLSQMILFCFLKAAYVTSTFMDITSNRHPFPTRVNSPNVPAKDLPISFHASILMIHLLKLYVLRI
jgi:hypothetical protein